MTDITQVNSDEYTRYIDTADIIIAYYKNQTTTGLEKYFLEIESWLSKPFTPEKNKPLVIQAEEGVGKKTLIVKWMEYHMANNKKTYKDLIIPNFAGSGGSNSSYFHSIYNILIKLREHFDISQKVELVEEKLRKYFHYWLDVCSRKIDSRVVDDSKIVLVFDSINLYTEPETGYEAVASTWLPKTFPQNVRTIVTVDSHSDALNYFKKLGCDIIKISAEPLVVHKQIDHHLSRPLFIADEQYKQRVVDILTKKTAESNKNSLFIRTYLSVLLPYPSDGLIKESDINKEDFKAAYANFDYKKLEAVETVPELISFILELFSKSILSPEKFSMLMSLFVLTQKGLSEAELFSITKVTQTQWNFVIAIFKTFLMKYNNFWKINNEVFKKAVIATYLTNPEYQIKLHNSIADVLEKVPSSIRKLEEQTYHLFCGETYFKLKEAVSNIENFLLMFNPNNKYELCRYWQRLEEKGFDPAFEYNKAVESFDMHYKPNPEDTFRIILQISRFLKEFSDFETRHTPDFRHPVIKGGDEVEDIGLRREIAKLGIYENDQAAPPPIRGSRDGTMLSESASAKTFRIEKGKPEADPTKKKLITLLGIPPGLEDAANKELLKSTNFSETILEGTGENRGNESTREVGPLKPKYLAPKKKMPLDEFFETLNVEITENKELVRKVYMAIGGLITAEQLFPGRVKVKKATNFMDGEELQNKLKEIEGEPVEQEHQELVKKGLEGQKERLGIIYQQYQKQLKLQKEEPIKTVAKRTNEYFSDQEPLFYYYKRWIWIMFPWVCISIQLRFSEIMEACFKSPTEYMSVRNEYEYTRQALKIAVEARIKKRMMYAKGEGPSALTISIHQSRIPARLGDPTFDESQIRGSRLQPIEESKLNNDPNLSQSMMKEDNTMIVEKNLLDNINSHRMERAIVHTTKHVNQKQFFVTNEFLNLATLNSQRTPQSEATMNNPKKSFLNKAENSISGGISVFGKARGYSEKNLGNVIEKGIDNALKDKSLMSAKHDLSSNLKKVSSSTVLQSKNNQSIQMKKRAVPTISVDTSASSILPKLQNSLHMHSVRGLVAAEMKVDILIKEFNDIVYKNKLLAKKLKDLNIKKKNIDSGSDANPVEAANNKIEELTAKANNMNKQLDRSKIEQKRLGTIISICLKNKMQNEAWSNSLTLILQNIKALTKLEKEASERNRNEIATIQKSSNYLFQVIRDKIDNHIKFIQHIKNELSGKSVLSKRLGNS